LVRVDAEAGTLEVLVEDFEDRPLATADLDSYQHGTGRELFAAFRNSVGPATTGASIFEG
jgi:phosphogluconate dehydratase